MRKIVVVFLMVTLVLTGVFAGGGSDSKGAAQKKVVVQIGLENHPGEPVTDGIYEWKRLAEEKSKGSMEVQVFPSSQMGSKNEIIDQMLAGMGAITLADNGFFVDRGTPDLGITSGPYFFATWDEVWNLLKSQWFADQLKILEGRGLKIITSNWVYGERHTLTKRPIRTVADFRGLKLRVPNNIIQLKGTEVMGATPTPLPLGDVYTALQQGVVDGVENPLSVLYGFKFFETAKFLTLDAHIRMMANWLTGVKFFNSLSKEHQALLVDTGNQAGLHNNKLVEAAEKVIIDKFKAEGVEIINVDIPAFQKQAQPFYNMPEVKSMWSANIIEATNKAKSGR